MLLAGDAVHIHSPAGGQGMNTGMNTGMLDATNLAWKLALTLGGRAPDRLLDSYGTERGPVAGQVMGLTQNLVRFGTARSVRRVLRDASLPALRLPPMQRRLADRVSQMAVSYPTGPLARPGRVGGLPTPGARMPDLQVRGTQGPNTLYAQLRRGRHVLVAPQGWADGVDLGRNRDLVDMVSPVNGQRPGLALVRPDGYVAAVGTPSDATAISAYLRELVPSSGAAEAALTGRRPSS